MAAAVPSDAASPKPLVWPLASVFEGWLCQKLGQLVSKRLLRPLFVFTGLMLESLTLGDRSWAETNLLPASVTEALQGIAQQGAG